jgi:hypothetical protein
MASEGNRGTGDSGFPGSRLHTSTRPGYGSEGASTSGVTGALKEKAQDLASTVTSSAEDAWDGARRGIRQAATAAAGTAGEAWTSMTQCMSRYPLATFGMGIFLGILLTRAFEWSPSLSWSRRQLEHPGRWDEGTRHDWNYRR